MSFSLFFGPIYVYKARIISGIVQDPTFQKDTECVVLKALFELKVCCVYFLGVRSSTL